MLVMIPEPQPYIFYLAPLQLICDADDPITAPASSIDNVATNSASPSYENVLSASFSDILTATVDTSAAGTKTHVRSERLAMQQLLPLAHSSELLRNRRKQQGRKSRRKTTKTSIRRRCQKLTRS